MHARLTTAGDSVGGSISVVDAAGGRFIVIVHASTTCGCTPDAQWALWFDPASETEADARVWGSFHTVAVPGAESS